MSSTKKALLCGINYIGQQYELRGCINDALAISQLLRGHYDYAEDNITLLTDKNIPPTRDNIIGHLAKLLTSGAKEMFFYYSGHGTNVTDYSNDEIDHKDECLVPVDYLNKGLITDDQVRALLRSLKPDQKLWIVIDACNSGTISDLQYRYKNESRRLFGTLPNFIDTEWTTDFMLSENKKYAGTVKGQIFSLSGCRDNQISVDALIKSKYQGVLTYFLIKTLFQENYDIKLKDLLKIINCNLKLRKYSQQPVIQSSVFLPPDTQISF